MKFLSFMNTAPGRAIRVAGGLALLGVGVKAGGGAGTGLAVFSLLPIATGVFGVCPISPLFGQPARACAVPKQRTTHPA